MKYVFTLLPEILFVVAALAVSIGMNALMGWEYALIFLGATVFVAAAYLSEVMKTVIE